ncbi:MAG: hypothetical protein IKR28_00480 [Selenomonadaceae bacterium]|nr:hypothetical protein [Selenomonadaceae bacterium]
MKEDFEIEIDHSMAKELNIVFKIPLLIDEKPLSMLYYQAMRMWRNWQTRWI